MPPNPPVPILATQANRTAPVVVTFNEPLVPGTSDSANWTGLAKNAAQPRRWTAALFDPVIADATVTVIPKLVGIDAGDPWVGYRATPPDIVSALTGVPAEPFLLFPVT